MIGHRSYQALTRSLFRLRRICSTRSATYSRLPASNVGNLKKKRKKEENRKDACHVDFHILSLMGTDTPAEMTRHARRRADYESKCFRMRKRVGGGAEEKDAGHVACPRRRESEPFRIPLKTVTFSRIALARRTSDDKLRTARATSDK